MKDPGYGAEGPSGDSLIINDTMRKEGVGLRKQKPLGRKGSASSNQATVPPRSEAEGGSASAVASAQELGGERSHPRHGSRLLGWSGLSLRPPSRDQAVRARRW